MTDLAPLLRVGVLNDYPVVVAGLTHILGRHDSRIRVVEVDPTSPALDEVDIVLCDSFGTVADGGAGLRALVGRTDAKVVLFADNLTDAAVEAAMRTGVAAYVSKWTSADDLVAVLPAIHRGERIASQSFQTGEHEGFGDWPGRGWLLTPREAEVLAHVAAGHSNDEIARTLFVSVNSVKTHVRSVYRKIGVKRRTQAVLWALEHGFVSGARVGPLPARRASVDGPTPDETSVETPPTPSS